MQTVLNKWGNSQGIRLPKEIIETAGLVLGENYDITAEPGKIIIKKSEKVTLDSLFKNYQGNYHSSEIDWGNKVGNEEW